LAFVTTPSPSCVAVCSSLHSVPSPDFPSLGPRPCEIPTGVDGPSLFNVVACKIMMYVFRSQLSPCVPIVETGQSRTPSPLERRLRRRPLPPSSYCPVATPSLHLTLAFPPISCLSQLWVGSRRGSTVPPFSVLSFAKLSYIWFCSYSGDRARRRAKDTVSIMDVRRLLHSRRIPSRGPILVCPPTRPGPSPTR
jgi:hypothetical protein